MGYDFFRKERPEVFLTRLQAPTEGKNFYSLRSAVIFEAKNASGAKKFAVEVSGRKRRLKATVSGKTLVISEDEGPNKDKVLLHLTEDSMHTALSLPRSAQAASLACQVARRLCQDHAVSSSSSPLISGCEVNNFAAATAYEGQRMHLTLKSRKPFANPLCSGNEKEVFLIGRVEYADCELVKYLGSTRGRTVSELVRGAESRIPKPG
jgi:hypothetical protein